MWIWPKCSLTDEWKSKTCHIHTKQCKVALKREGFLTHALTWRDLESIMLSDMCQKEEDKYCIIPFIFPWIGKFIETDSRLEVVRSWGSKDGWGIQNFHFGWCKSFRKSTNGYTTLWMYWCHWLAHLQMVKMENFMLYMLYHNRKIILKKSTCSSERGSSFRFY